ncbi:putative FtsJ cell division protein [Trypanosoma theileri]|uniref:Putative rRNA methyltransferase n=1 Tax=Trypanosoma theileri TaxID=67003 RepID=A0A1X0NSL6_9TRYP|nr:putative FtsJ cell division protein [Trypanosoma theileri]ORC87179.1 putative FtsJ cell division protein [Trypanosoma theileri]
MGTKSKKKAKTRLDAYYRLAKDQGYRARSAFKLIQLNRKYDFLAKSRVLVDLCAAPGGWCQVAAKHMPVGSKIVGVDLVPIAPIRGVKTFVGDITDDKTRKIIITYLKKEPVDCVIHDGAPNVGGVWSRDLFEQNALVLHAAKMACSMLRPAGWFVTKVFRSQDFHKLMWVMQQLFDKVEATKPLASRMESAEIFVVCAGFKAPKQLDPAMFNAQKVFSDVGEEKILTPSGALVVPRSNVPVGYTEFATVSHHVAAFTDFLKCDEPKTFLRTHHELRFATPEDKVYLKSRHSKKELVYLCGDLQQVGDADLRRMLRWREQLLREDERKRKLAGIPEGDDEYNDEEDEESQDNADSNAAKDDDDDGKIDFDSAEGVAKIARELLELRKRQSKELKKKQKKIVDRKLKQIKGLINYDPSGGAEQVTDGDGFMKEGGADDDEDNEDANDDNDEFDEGFTVEKLALVDEVDVAKILDKHWEEPDERLNDPLNPVMNANLNAEQDWDLGKDEDDENDETSSNITDARGPLQLVEGEEDGVDVDNYGNYIPAKRSARVTLYEEGLVDHNEEEEEEEEEDAEDTAENRRKAKDQQDLDNAGKQSKWLRHHVNVEKVLNQTFPKPRDNGKQKRNKRALEEDRVEMAAAAPLNVADSLNGHAARKKTRFDDRVDDDDDDDNFSDLSEDRFSDDRSDLEIRTGREDSRRKRAIIPDIGKLTTQELVRQQRKQVLKENAELRKRSARENGNSSKVIKKKTSTNGGGNRKDETTFEEIPVALTDPHVRARTLAIATKMLDKKGRRDILEASINRYTYNDDEDLPDWFIKDEQRNCKVILPVTAEEIEAQRVRFQEMNARPGKKVMEAVQRKRKRAQRMLRGMIEKGKVDPRAREKANNMSVRRLMRSQALKSSDGRLQKKKKGPLDRKKMGEMRRTRQRLKRQK